MQGASSVNESMITGESASVFKEVLSHLSSSPLLSHPFVYSRFTERIAGDWGYN